LHLWAAFREGGYDVAHDEAPDFRVRAPGVAFAVEATTLAPSKDGALAQHPNPQSPEELAAFLADLRSNPLLMNPLRFAPESTGHLIEFR
jgi:hypothetical protein